MTQPAVSDGFALIRKSAASVFPSDSLQRDLLLAATNGDSNSQFNVGVIYSNIRQEDGSPVPEDRREAIRWLRKAARQGLPRAQLKLAEIYSDGYGPPRDDLMGCFWFVVAISSVGPYGLRAQAAYKRMAHRLTADQIERLERRAHRWKPVGGRPSEQP